MAGSKRLGGPRAPPLQSKSATTTKHSKDKASSTTSKFLELPAKLRNRTTASATASTAASTPSPSTFLTLPPEVRNNIYRFALISNGPVKMQFSSGRRRSSPLRFTMIPGLINVSKQLRSETLRIFFENNTFEITPEVWKLRERMAIPLLLLRTMHQNLGLELRSVKVCQEIKMRDGKKLFQAKASFTVTMGPGSGLTIVEEDYSATYIGRPLPIVPHLGVCGCEIAFVVRSCNRVGRGSDVEKFLLRLKDYNQIVHKHYRSRHFRDLFCKDQVVDTRDYCRNCRRHGRRMVCF